MSIKKLAIQSSLGTALICTVFFFGTQFGVQNDVNASETAQITASAEQSFEMVAVREPITTIQFSNHAMLGE